MFSDSFLRLERGRKRKMPVFSSFKKEKHKKIFAVVVTACYKKSRGC
jgi:hypothetical protein